MLNKLLPVVMLMMACSRAVREPEGASRPLPEVICWTYAVWPIDSGVMNRTTCDSLFDDGTVRPPDSSNRRKTLAFLYGFDTAYRRVMGKGDTSSGISWPGWRGSRTLSKRIPLGERMVEVSRWEVVPYPERPEWGIYHLLFHTREYGVVYGVPYHAMSLMQIRHTFPDGRSADLIPLLRGMMSDTTFMNPGYLAGEDL